jgi:hypothetical protein
MRTKTQPLQCAHLESGACEPCLNPLSPFKRDDEPVFRSARLRNVAKLWEKTPLLLRQAMKANQANRTGATSGRSTLLALAERRISKMIYA